MLEVCVDTVQAAMAACQAGAERLELCAALEVGGVTPPRSLVEAVRRRVTCPLAVLVRPRTGHFVYDALDFEQIANSVRELLTCRVECLVVGGLTSEAQVDVSLLRAVRDLVPQTTQLVMHRAFDWAVQPDFALEQLISLGFQRVLTAGGPGQAIDHLEQLQRLNRQAAGRITIMPGGGVTARNAQSLLQQTGCRQLHGSFRLPAASLSPAIDRSFGSNCSLDLGGIAQVRQFLHAAE